MKVSMRRAGWMVMALAAAGACRAQGFSEVDFRGTAVEGFHIYQVSAFSGYSSSAYPTNYIFTAASGPAPALTWNVNYGAALSAGWQHHRKDTNVSIAYTLTYGGQVNYTNLNGLNHSLMINLTQKLTPKWTFGVFGSGEDVTVEQLIYQPSTLAVTAQTPSSFNNLAASQGVGSFTDSQAASMLTGTGAAAASAANSAAGSSLLGNRMLTYAASASMDYAATERLTIHFGGVSAGGQSQIGGQQTFVTPRTTGIDASAGFSYAASPRTQVGLSVDGFRSSNSYQTAYTSNVAASLGRKMGEHWFLRGSLGGSRSITVQQATGSPKQQQVIGTGSVGYQLHAQTLLASFDRSSYDTYGFGIGTHSNSALAWSWHRPGAGWSVFSSFAYQQMAQTGFASFNGWSASAGLTENLTDHIRMTAQYVHFHSDGDYLGVPSKVAVDSVRLTFGWSPQSVLASLTGALAQTGSPHN